jgi:hypothetical protein
MFTIGSFLTAAWRWQPTAIFAHTYYGPSLGQLALFAVLIVLAFILAIALMAAIIRSCAQCNDYARVREQHAGWAAEVAKDPVELYGTSGKVNGDEDMRLLRETTRLRRLSLAHSNVTGEQLVHLEGLSELTGLSLNDSLVDDTGLRHVGRLHQLQELDLSRLQNVTDAGLRQVENLTELRRLNLSGIENITNAGLRHLRSLVNLRQLSLSLCYSITDAGLENLDRLRDLEQLDLSGCSFVTDISVKHLKCLSALKWLRTSRTAITSNGLGELRRALPLCEVLTH